MQERTQQTNVFRNAVEATADLKDGYRQGLKALGADTKKVTAGDTRELLGSVDIDSCTRKLYPEESRWDYAVGYNQQALFIEVHPACTSSVDEMIKKVQWLKTWLATNGRELEKIKRDERFYWVPSGRMNILKLSPQYRRISQNKLIITKVPFRLDHNTKGTNRTTE